ncbi:MAG TPA: copper resistance protein CopC [Candidatus Limnocylindrales bacterium]|nr:copper resistance protein CopC [Candidatus Limnocylindrales bacterium]
MIRKRLGPGVGATSLALVALLALAGPAGAHALPQASTPAAGATLSTPPTTVSISFGERPDPGLSSINVLDSTGSPVTAGPTRSSSTDPLTLEVALKPLAGGVYTVAWRTVSAIDGHRATGSFAFGLGTSPPGAGSSAGSGTLPQPSSGPSAAAIVGRWLLYLGLVALLGVGFFGALIAPVPSWVIRRVLPATWLIAAAGTAAVIVDQLAEAGVDPGQVFATSFGPAIVERVVPLAIAGLAVGWAARARGRSAPGASQRSVLVVVALAAAGALLADVLSSHAAAGRTPAIDILVQGLHVIAAGLWIGGLLGLLLAMRHRDPDASTARATKRFSRIATAGIAGVAVTGVVRAISEVGTIDALVATDFGRLVIAKTALLAILAVLGAINHFRNVPAAGRALLGLRRVGSIELLVGGTAVLLAASLVNLAPPSSVAAAGSGPVASPTPAPLVIDGHDFGTSVRLGLEVSPGLTGFNTFRATVTDYDTGAPVTADGVTLRFSIPARSDVGGSRLDLAPAGPGVFSATGGNLSLDGAWQVTAVVARGSTSVEVPLTILAQSARQQIDVSRVAGIPTIYTVHLTGGRTVQVYLDPDKAGRNDFHVTFFDAAGTELPATNIGVTVATSATAATPLTVRTLEPGHVVATLTVQSVSQIFAIVATAPNGDQLRAELVITPGS